MQIVIVVIIVNHQYNLFHILIHLFCKNLKAKLFASSSVTIVCCVSFVTIVQTKKHFSIFFDILIDYSTVKIMYLQH